MAYATQDQVLQQLQGGQQQVDPTAARPIGSTGGGGIVETGAGAAPQAGAGGQKLWTNIQSYLSAAQPQQAQRAQAVGQKGQEILQKGQQEFQTQKESTLGEAQKAASPVLSIGQDKASQLVNQAAQAATSAFGGRRPSFGVGRDVTSPQMAALQGASPLAGALGGQKQVSFGVGRDVTPGYDEALKPLREALGAQYTAPKQFTFGVGRDVSELGRQAADESGFKNFLSQFDVGQQGGRGLSTGQRGLQEQLDVANPELEKVRQQVASQYQGLMGEQQAQSAEANKALQDIYGQFTTGQQALRGQLTGMGTQTMSDLEKAVAEQNKATQKADVDYQNYINKLNEMQSNLGGYISTYGGNLQNILKDVPLQNRDLISKINLDEGQKLLKGAPQTSGKSREENAALQNYINKLSPQEKANFSYASMMNKLTPEQRDRYLNPSKYDKNVSLSQGGYEARQQQLKGLEQFQNYVNAVQATPEYKKGGIADVSTLGGKEQDVAKYNALMDLLGGQKVEQKAPVAGSTLRDKTKYTLS